MVRAVVVSGYKRSGKTSVVEGLVEELVARGYKVGTIKHISHEDFTFDREGSDTWRHSKAGSQKVLALSPGEKTTLEDRDWELGDVLLEMNHLDFVVLEGFKGSENIARIVVAENESEAMELEDEFTIGFVNVGVGEKPVFNLEDFPDIADLVEKRAVMPVGGLDCGYCGYETCREFVLASLQGEVSTEGCTALRGAVTLRVDGREVPLKPFVKDLVRGTVLAMVSSLKKTEGGKIELEIWKDQG